MSSIIFESDLLSWFYNNCNRAEFVIKLNVNLWGIYIIIHGHLLQIRLHKKREYVEISQNDSN
jgi:hypothetical protein